MTDKYVYAFNERDPYGIEVRKEIREKVTAPVFYLKSDQLGFSAPGDKKHPYDIYLEKSNEKQEAAQNVAEWVYWSRGIGGSFLWPMESRCGNKWEENPRINRDRGGSNPYNDENQYNKHYNRYWIEDRADLTLLEIKRVLDFNSNINEGKSILWQCCFTETNLMKWLKHFGTFKKYVEFFCFGSFVNDKNIPRDITQKDATLNEENDYFEREENTIFKMKADDLEMMFNQLKGFIRKKSDDMKKCLID